jgi:hypothetical protein
VTIKPVPGMTWAARTRPVRLRANYRKPHGSRQLYACYSIGEGRLWGTIEPAKGLNKLIQPGRELLGA